MDEQFYTILTNIGKAKIANSNVLGTKLNLSKFIVGDSNGSYYNPTENQISLKNKVWEGSINSISIDKDNPNWIIIESIIPAEVGGFTIREAGILDNENNLIAVAKYPETYKPLLKNGSSKDIILRVILEVSNSKNVTLKVNPNTVIATRKDIDNVKKIIEDIKVGGSNLIINSGYCKNLSYWSKNVGGGNTSSEIYIDNVTKGVSLKCLFSNGGWCILGNTSLKGYKFNISKEYILSGVIWCDKKLKLDIQIADNNSTNLVTLKSFEFNQGYNKFTFKFKPNCEGNENTIRFCINNIGIISLPYIQLQEGNVVTPWTSSPKDLEEILNNNSNNLINELNKNNSNVTKQIKTLSSEVDKKLEKKMDQNTISIQENLKVGINAYTTGNTKEHNCHIHNVGKFSYVHFSVWDVGVNNKGTGWVEVTLPFTIKALYSASGNVYTVRENNKFIYGHWKAAQYGLTIYANKNSNIINVNIQGKPDNTIDRVGLAACVFVERS